MTSTISEISKAVQLPEAVEVIVAGESFFAPAKATKPDPENPTKLPGVWYEGKRNVPIVSGRTGEEILSSLGVEFSGEAMKAGPLTTSKVNEARGTGGNPTRLHTVRASLGDGEGIVYQFQVRLTALDKGDDGQFVQVWTKAFRAGTPKKKGVQEIGDTTATGF